MKAPTRARPKGAAIELNLAPLIDAVFLLLTYFLFTISLATIEGVLPSELAAGNRFEQERLPLHQPERQLVVRLIDTGGGVAYFVDDWPAAGIEEVMARISALGPQDVVVIDADPNVAYDYVIRLYNRSLGAGIRNVVFPIEPLERAAPRS
ncbi:MAG: biopolymer transporter ExbD [Candidatus Dadabacteria bacterium]|nr:MAG: biopolymer transporter ExbD [Candidatus Dadabacteria bacterium]